MNNFVRNPGFLNILIIFIITVNIFFLFTPGAYPGFAATRHNILLITIDTLRADRLGCYGSVTVDTPAIDSLANRGLLFERAFAHSTLTLPSHANILLGLTSNAHGIHDNANFIVRQEFLTIAEWLKKFGYATGAFVGAFPLDSRFGLNQGFDIYDDNCGSQAPLDPTFVERPAAVVVGLAQNWIKKSAQPWFCWIHCFDPHQPYNPPEPFQTKYRERPYDGEIAYVDSALSSLLTDLERNGLNQNTIIILTADHGEALGEHGEATHGYFAYNATLHVPLIIAAPGLKPARIRTPVSHVDIFPTLCRLLGQRTPAILHGQPIVPASDVAKAKPRMLYFESLAAHYNRGWAPLYGYIEGNTKFIESPIPELYDIDADFHENTNLAESREISGYRKKLEALIKYEFSPLAESAGQTSDRKTLEKLRSLGYLVSSARREKKIYSERDDLKTLLPFHDKWMKATAAYNAGKISQGMELLKQIINERKDFDQAYINLANYYKQQGRLSDAETLLRDGLDNNPGNFRLMTALGIILIDAGRMDEAVDILERSLAVIDFDPETWNYLGVAYWNKGFFEKSLTAYERALVLDANYPIVFNNLGSLYLSIYLQTRNRDNLDKAAANFSKAIDADPNYASAYNGLGAVLFQSGDIEAAISNWKKAVSLKPDFDMPLYNLGVALLARGEKTEALSCLTRYKELTYNRLSAAEKNRLEALIEKCK